MKHFVVEIIYKAPIEKITELRPVHREFLKKGYEKGLLLVSGPQTPQIGGIVIARAESMEEIAEYFSGDPYSTANAAHYQFIEFNPVSRQEFMNGWIDDK